MEKSTCKFERYFKRLLKEDMTAGDAGMQGEGGFSPENPNSSDSYAEGDSRTPFPIFGKGKVLKRADVGGKKKKKKKKAKVYLPGENEEEGKVDVGSQFDVRISSGFRGPKFKHKAIVANAMLEAINKLKDVFAKEFDTNPNIDVMIKNTSSRKYGSASSFANKMILNVDGKGGMKDFLNTVAHELTHFEQFKIGRLTYDEKKRTFWDGKLIRGAKPTMDMEKYRNAPWEVEARERADEFIVKYAKVIESLGELPVADEQVKHKATLVKATNELKNVIAKMLENFVSTLVEGDKNMDVNISSANDKFVSSVSRFPYAHRVKAALKDQNMEFNEDSIRKLLDRIGNFNVNLASAIKEGETHYSFTPWLSMDPKDQAAFKKILPAKVFNKMVKLRG